MMTTFFKRFQWMALIFIALLTFTAYSSALNGGFIWDDDLYITQNPLLTAPGGLWQIWTTTKSPQYYPLVFTTFWIEQRLWGLNPAGYHLVNLFLHALNSILVWWLLRRLELPGAWMVGAVFAVHPINVESVAWISERKNVLSALFYLLSIGCYLQYESKRSPPGQPGRLSWYAAALALFIFALFSKTVVATLPVALLLIRYLKGWRIGRKEVLELVPFFLIGAAMGLVTKWYEAHLVGAEGPEWNLSIPERLLVACRALFFYIGKLLWPVNLTFNYPRWQPDIRDPVQWGWVVGIAAIGLLLWWKRRAWGRGPLVAAAFFSVSLSPALGFLNVYPMRYSFVADHFQYLAGLGIIALIIGSAARIFDRLNRFDPQDRSHLTDKAKPALGLLVLVILATLAWKQGLIYRNLETLWLDTLNKNPASWLAHTNLGTVYLRQGLAEEAAQEFLIALKLYPDHIAHFNLGNAYSKQGRLEEAVQEFLKALKLQPDFIDAHNNLGNAYSRQGHLEEAIREYLIVLKLNPDQVDGHYNLGNVYFSQGRLEAAVQEYLAALKLQPNFHIARYNLGFAYSRQGRQEDAIREYLTVIKMQPYFIDAHNSLGIVYFSQDRPDEAMQEFLAVLKLDPNHIEARYNLGNVYKLKGLKDEARKQFEMVLRLEPGLVPAKEALESLGPK